MSSPPDPLIEYYAGAWNAVRILGEDLRRALYVRATTSSPLNEQELTSSSLNPVPLLPLLPPWPPRPWP